MTMYGISTDAIMTEIDAGSADEAAAKFALDEGFAARNEADLRAELGAMGGWLSLDEASSCDPTKAHACHGANAPQAWASPQEMEAAASGDWPDGTIDDCRDGDGPFRRIWHDQSAIWYRV